MIAVSIWSASKKYRTVSFLPICVIVLLTIWCWTARPISSAAFLCGDTRVFCKIVYREIVTAFVRHQPGQALNHIGIPSNVKYADSASRRLVSHAYLSALGKRGQYWHHFHCTSWNILDYSRIGSYRMIRCIHAIWRRLNIG